MQTRISKTFEKLKAERKKGFVAYISAGDPRLKATVEIVRRLEEAGADFIELGVPFSDPLADGKTNQLAAARALTSGTTVKGILDCVAQIRKQSEIPIVLFTYINPLYAYGFSKVCRDAASAGVDGMLMLDLPVEENAEFVEQLRKRELDNICLVAPTSTDERVAKTVAAGTGFVYCVSRAGVTGAQQKTSSAKALIRRVGKHTTLPTALGFGVSNPAQARAAVAEADAVVVGSAIVQRFHDAPHNAAGRKAAAAWVATLVKAVKEA